MKRHLFLVTILSLTILFSMNAKANIAIAEPQNCPDVSAMKSAGVSKNVLTLHSGLWLAGRRDQLYNTPNHWAFLVGNIKADNATQAYSSAAKSLDSLIFAFGPFLGPLGKWICTYTNAQGYTVVTLTPPLLGSLNSQYLNY